MIKNILENSRIRDHRIEDQHSQWCKAERIGITCIVGFQLSDDGSQDKQYCGYACNSGPLQNHRLLRREQTRKERYCNTENGNRSKYTDLAVSGPFIKQQKYCKSGTDKKKYIDIDHT